jgi:hypothetical protein
VNVCVMASMVCLGGESAGRRDRGRSPMTPREAIAKLRSLGFEVEAPRELPGYVFVGWAGRPDTEPAVPDDVLDVWAAQRDGV